MISAAKPLRKRPANLPAFPFAAHFRRAGNIAFVEQQRDTSLIVFSGADRKACRCISVPPCKELLPVTSKLQAVFFF